MAIVRDEAVGSGRLRVSHGFAVPARLRQAVRCLEHPVLWKPEKLAGSRIDLGGRRAGPAERAGLA